MPRSASAADQSRAPPSRTTTNRAAVLGPASRRDAALAEQRDEPSLQRERMRAQPRDAERQREHLPRARLVERQHRRRRFEPGVAARGEARRIGTRVGERRLLGEPAGVERAQAAVEMARRDVQEARARAAAQVLVAAADGEVDVERRDVDRKHAERMVDVEQHARAGGVRAGDDRRQVRQHLPGLEHHLRDHDEVGARHDRGEHDPRRRSRRPRAARPASARCARAARTRAGSRRANRTRRASRRRAARDRTC